jgi:hypothetical protein
MALPHTFDWRFRFHPSSLFNDRDAPQNATLNLTSRHDDTTADKHARRLRARSHLPLCVDSIKTQLP